MEEYELVLLVKPEVFVFRLPPLSTNRGYKRNIQINFLYANRKCRKQLNVTNGISTKLMYTAMAADWNLNNPDWIGRLRLICIGSRLEIRLEDKTTGNLYAKAPIAEQNGVDFESVADSSRYFVIRLKNESGQTAFVGIGFADRGDSFDLSVAVQDHFKSVKKIEEDAKNDGKNEPKLDLGFKEGQTITVNIGKKAGDSPGHCATARPKPRSESSGIVPLLPPPPSNSSSNRIRGAQSKPND